MRGTLSALSVKEHGRAALIKKTPPAKFDEVVVAEKEARTCTASRIEMFV